MTIARLLAACFAALLLAAGLTQPASASNPLTMSGATYDTSGQALGSAALNGGYGTGPTGVLTYPLTIEARVKTTATSGLGVAAAIDNGPWIGYYSGAAYAAGAASTVYLNDGAYHRLKAVWTDADHVTLYLDNNPILTGSSAAAGPTSGALRVGNFNFGGSTNGFQFAGDVDEVAFWPSAVTTATPSAAYSGSEGMVALYHLDGDGSDSAGAAALSIGSLSATGGDGSISIALSAGLAGGSGAGYGYSVYRGTDPNFTANTGSLLASPLSMPFVDTTATVGTQYFYGVQGSDSLGAVAKAVPTGEGAATGAGLFYASASLNAQPLALVTEGDSITYGIYLTGAGTTGGQTPEAYMLARLRTTLGLRTITAANKGVSGTTTTDWQPGSTNFVSAKSAMTSLLSATPAALPLFSIMLGTNDSAQSSVNNSGSSPMTPAQFKANLKAIVDQHLADFPACKVILHQPIFYSLNAAASGGAAYGKVGGSALVSYFPQIAQLITDYGASAPGRVLAGDALAYSYFATNYAAELRGEAGANGTFYIHPNATGAQSLGEFWGAAIARALSASGSGAGSLRPAFRAGFR